MKHLTSLFRLLEITRAQSQQGYILAEIPKSDISDLAQHHYLVTFIAWQLARLVQRAGGKIALERVLELALVHDLGELFGGDIGMPYARANPAARTAAKEFEIENQRYLSTLFGDDRKYIESLFAEVMDPTTDEGRIAKIADYVEVTQYKLYVHRLSPGDVAMALNQIKKRAGQLDDAKTKRAMLAFARRWSADLKRGKSDEIFERAKTIT